MKFAMDAETFRKRSTAISRSATRLWDEIPSATGQVYDWPKSTYIAEPPFFDDFSDGAPATSPDVNGARALGIFGDSITTDHISPAGSIKDDLAGRHVAAGARRREADFNSYGSRRGNHEVMMRGTFANVRIKNLMIARAREGGVTIYQPSGEQMSIYDAAMKLSARQARRPSCSAARNTAPARRATGRPKARSCSASRP